MIKSRSCHYQKDVNKYKTQLKEQKFQPIQNQICIHRVKNNIHQKHVHAYFAKTAFDNIHLKQS